MGAGVDVWSATFTEEMTEEDKEAELRIRWVRCVGACLGHVSVASVVIPAWTCALKPHMTS